MRHLLAMKAFCSLILLPNWLFLVIEASFGHEHVHIRVHVPQIIHKVHHRKKTYIHQQYPPTIIHRPKEIIDYDDREPYILPGEDDFSSSGVASEDYHIFDKFEPNQEKFFMEPPFADFSKKGFSKNPDSKNIKFLNLLNFKGSNLHGDDEIISDIEHYPVSGLEINGLSYENTYPNPYDTNQGHIFSGGRYHTKLHNANQAVVHNQLQVIGEDESVPWSGSSDFAPSGTHGLSSPFSSISNPFISLKQPGNKFNSNQNDYFYED